MRDTKDPESTLHVQTYPHYMCELAKWSQNFDWGVFDDFSFTTLYDISSYANFLSRDHVARSECPKIQICMSPAYHNHE